MVPDRIEKSVLLKAPLSRVWRALTDSTEFGTWFGMKFDGPFITGSEISGFIVPTKVNAEIARAQEPYRDTPFTLFIETIEPERIFSYRWHPGAVDPAVDYSSEPTTLVVFSLEETPEGVLLTITESGFERIPLARRATAFGQNEGGWNMVSTLIADYLGAA